MSYSHVMFISLKEEFTEIDEKLYRDVIKRVERFFFDLIFLGYVEDAESGLSFNLPGDLQWSLYFEVSCTFSAKY